METNGLDLGEILTDFHRILLVFNGFKLLKDRHLHWFTLGLRQFPPDIHH
jgi:hypothetical protein